MTDTHRPLALVTGASRWERVIDLNVRSTVALAKKVLRDMARRDEGKVRSPRRPTVRQTEND